MTHSQADLTINGFAAVATKYFFLFSVSIACGVLTVEALMIRRFDAILP